VKKDNKRFASELKKRIYKFILSLISFIDSLPKNDSLCQIVTKQLLRSGTSIGANYAEAIAGSSRKDFTNFLTHSLKSANESKFWLALLRDTKKINNDAADVLLKELEELSKILASSIKTLKNKNG
jgi:four helix bundle protein